MRTESGPVKTESGLSVDRDRSTEDRIRPSKDESQALVRTESGPREDESQAIVRMRVRPSEDRFRPH